MPVREMISTFPKWLIKLKLIHTSEVYQIDIITRSIHVVSFIIDNTLEILRTNFESKCDMRDYCIGQLSLIEHTGDSSGGNWTLGECSHM